MTDIIDRLAGVRPGGSVDALRRHRPATRDNAQASYDALFTDPDERHASLAERASVAQFVAILHDDEVAATHYGALTRSAGGDALADAVADAATAARTEGPYGEYPADGPLAAESVPGPRLTLDDAARAVLGERLAAALGHAHLLVFRPRESSAVALATLADAGWSTDGIVTLSQLVSFLAFQLRVAAGLRLLTTKDAA
ncbi:CMD domain protein [Agromyces mariniharenae]|uniref:CMD domain protein n=1 Tax=Agromyces mariniharenae TaxID=2604423 RepID=A0A5S4V510_9MICO|nr:CMD domain protein [Agromyces mariniharenae]TYL53119.1 CMD domain protein [Agromyces mariniharenae]